MTDAQRKIAEDNINLCYWKAHRYMHEYGESFFARIGIDIDDLISLGYMALCKCAVKYDPRRGTFASLYTWAYYNEVRQVIRHAYSKNGRAMTESCSYDAIMDDEGNAYLELIGAKEDDVSDDMAELMKQEIVMVAHSVLSPKAIDVLYLTCVENKTQAEISTLVGVAQSHVCRILKKARARLRIELYLLGYDV